MEEPIFKFVWRCIRCSCHFANIISTGGILKQEKKCPKCKSINELTLSNREIVIHCQLYDPAINNYGGIARESYPFPDPGME